MKFISSVFLVFIILACQKEETPTVPAIYEVPAEIQGYIDTFKKEADARGVKVNLTNLIVNFNTNITADKCGQCSQKVGNEAFQRIVTINKNGLCWKDAFAQSREALLFHELGHCILGRIAHKDDLLPNQAPASLMNTNDNDQYSPCLYSIDGSNTCNRTNRRQYYMDELFDPKTPVPSWAKI